MTITRTTLGISDIQWINRSWTRGPNLRFSLTWKGTTEEDLTPAISIPGFRLMKDGEREVKLMVPSVKRPGAGQYHVAQVSVDLANWILNAFRAQPKIWNKIGQNYKPERMLDLPDELVPDLPENVELIG